MRRSPQLESVLAKHASKGLLIDTNVLIMYIVGLFDRNYIPQFKRTRQYTPDDFLIVQQLARTFHRLITTPHILAELSNLSVSVREPHAAVYFRRLTELLNAAKEHYTNKDILLRDARLARLGFTDLSIVEAAKDAGYLVLTDDLDAANAIRAERCNVINLNELRQWSWSQ